MRLTIKTFRYLMPAVCTLLSVCAHAQELLLRHFTAKDGLAANTVYNSYQDSKGFVWFCTSQGISRFDGHTFKNFTTREGLPDNEVFGLREDPYGRIWVTSYNGKACFIQNGKVFNAGNNIFCRFMEQDPLLQKIRMNAGNISPDTMLKDIPGLVSKLKAYSYVNSSEVIHLGRNDREDIFFSHNSTFTVKNGKITMLPVRGVVAEYTNGSVYISSWSPDHNTWIRKIALGADTAGPVICPDIPAAVIYYFSVVNDSVLWLATDKGVLTYLPAANRIEHERVLLKNTPVSSIKKDVENNYWFTSLNDGVYFLPASKPVVYNKHNTSAATIAVLPSGALVAAYDSGQVHVFDEHRTHKYVLPNLTMKDRILKILPLSNTRMLLGADMGTYSINTSSGKLTNHNYHPLNSAIKDLYEQNGRVFFSCVHGAGELDSNANLFAKYWNHRTTAIAAADEIVWLGTLQGVFKFERHKGIQKFAAAPVLAKSRITDIEIAPRGEVVFLTHQEGVFIWNGRSMQHINEKNGLSSNICRKAFVDDKQQIWISTNNGLDRLLPGKEGYTVSHFPLSNGLAENDINDFAIRAGNLYISSGEGIVRLNTPQRAATGPLYTCITSVALSDTAVVSPAHLLLSHKDAGLTINYTAVALNDGQNLTYKYVLEGSKADTVVTRLASVNFDAISPGSYVFKVWAKGSNDIWTKEPAVFSFTITPPFWRDPWFLLAVLLAAVVLAYVLVRKRISAIRRSEQTKTELNKKMANLEMQALRAQINPHFIFNALNAIQNYYNLNDERNANKYMTMFAHLIRQTLSHSKDNWIRLSEEADMLRAYIELEKMRFKNVFEYGISIAPDIDAEGTKIPAMMIQPFVENAINHGLRHLRGKSGKLNVSFSLTERGMLCVIDDTGIGFKQAAAMEKKSIYQPMGMDITTSRINVMNMLYNTSSIVNVIHKNDVNPGSTGTTVEVIIPVVKTMNDE